MAPAKNFSRAIGPNFIGLTVTKFHWCYCRRSVIKGFLHFKVLFWDGWVVCFCVCNCATSGKKTSHSPCEKAIQTPANEGNAICTLHVTVLRMPPWLPFSCHISGVWIYRKERDIWFLLDFSMASTIAIISLRWSASDNDMIIFYFFNCRVVFFRLWHLRLLCTFLILSKIADKGA